MLKLERNWSLKTLNEKFGWSLKISTMAFWKRMKTWKWWEFSDEWRDWNLKKLKNGVCRLKFAGEVDEIVDLKAWNFSVKWKWTLEVLFF